MLQPGESYVEFQLAAQDARPESFGCVAGCGECAPGYIPTERHIAEKDSILGDWYWVAPGSEARLLAANRGSQSTFGCGSLTSEPSGLARYVPGPKLKCWMQWLDLH